MSTVPDIHAWRHDKAAFLARVAARAGTLKIVLKTKNEHYFLDRWITHHARIVGLENLVIFDNMSFDERVHRVYRRYGSRVPIVRFEHHHNLLHDSTFIPELYRCLQQSCQYFCFLDADEFLVHIADDIYSCDGRILDDLREDTTTAAFPGTWLENTPEFTRRFTVGPSIAGFGPGLAFGKPIVRASAYVDGGYYLHNIQIPKHLFRGDIRPNYFVLHMKNVSAMQRIDANINKLVAAGIIGSDRPLDAVLDTDLDRTKERRARNLIDETKHLLTGTFADRATRERARVGWMELGRDQRVHYSGTAQAAALHEYLAAAQDFCAAVLQTDFKTFYAPSRDRTGSWHAIAEAHRRNKPSHRPTSRSDSRRGPNGRPRRGSASVCLAGSHRSGMSMVTSILNLAGLYLGEPSGLHGPLDDSREAPWEQRSFVALNDELLNELGGGWDCPVHVPVRLATGGRLRPFREKAAALMADYANQPSWGWTDPCNSVTLRFWQAVSGRLKVVLCVRNPLDVALSLTARHAISSELSLRQWRIYKECVLDATRPGDRLVTHYEAYFDDPRAEIRRVLEFLDRDTSPSTLDVCATAIEDRLRHHRSTSAHLVASELAPDLIALYARLLAEGDRRADVRFLRVRPRRSRTGRASTERRRRAPTRHKRVHPAALDLVLESTALRSALTVNHGVLDALRRDLDAERVRRTQLEAEASKHRFHDLLGAAIPIGSSVLIVSRGDNGSSQELIDELEAIRATRTVFLALPAMMLGRLDHDVELRAYLAGRCRLVLSDAEAGVVFEMSKSS